MARLVELAVLRRGLVVAVRVLVVKASSFQVEVVAVAIRPAIVSRPAIAIVMPTTTVVVLLTGRKLLELLPIVLFELVVKLVLGGKTKTGCRAYSGACHCQDKQERYS